MNDIGQTPSINPVAAQKTAQTSSAIVNTPNVVGNAQPADSTRTNTAQISTAQVNAAQINSAQSADKTKEDTKPNEAEVNSALDNANAYVQNIQRDLVFSVDKDLDQTVIKVVESESGKVIRQIPEDVFLELAKNLETGGELNLVNASG